MQFEWLISVRYEEATEVVLTKEKNKSNKYITFAKQIFFALPNFGAQKLGTNKIDCGDKI